MTNGCVDFFNINFYRHGLLLQNNSRNDIDGRGMFWIWNDCLILIFELCSFAKLPVGNLF